MSIYLSVPGKTVGQGMGGEQGLLRGVKRWKLDIEKMAAFKELLMIPNQVSEHYNGANK